MVIFIACVIECCILLLIGKQICKENVDKKGIPFTILFIIAYSWIGAYYSLHVFIIYIMISIIFLSFFEKKNVFLRLFAALLSYAILIYTQAICVSWVPAALYEVNMGLASLLVELITGIILGMVFFFFRWRKVDINCRRMRNWQMFIAVAIALCILFFCMRYRPILEAEYHIDLQPLLILIGGIMIVVLATVYESSRIKYRETLNAMQNQLRTYEAQLNSAHERSHEYAKQLSVLQLSGNMQLAERLLEKEKWSELLQELQPIVREVIESYGIKLQTEKIKLNVCIKDAPPVFRLKEDEIISVFGNLLDNAMDAVRELSEEMRWIHLELGEKDCQWIRCTNPYKGEITRTEDILARGVSSKGKNRGFGLFLVHKIVKRNEGEIRVIESSGCFTIEIDL